MSLNQPKMLLHSIIQKLSELFAARQNDLDTESMKARFPPLDKEPRRLMILGAHYLQSGATKSYNLSGAPPPYHRSIPSVHEDDCPSGHSSEFSYNTNGSLGAKRRSWDNLINAEENLHNLKTNTYPKIASSTCSAQSLPQKVSPTHYSTQIGGSKPATARYSTANSVFSEFGKPMAYKANYMMAPLPAGSSSEIPAGMPGSRAPTAATTITNIDPPAKKRDRMNDMRACWSKPSSKLCCLAILILLIAAIVVAVVLTQVFALPRHLNFQWLAPDSQRHGNSNPNNLEMDVADQQVRMELHGTMPFKSNYVSVIDFRTNRVAIVDSALKQGGKNMICFVMDLDRANIRSIEDFQRAAWNSEKKRSLNSGWDESWNFIPQVIDSSQASQMFKPDVAECRGARWVQLNLINAYQKNNKCNECFDFCLPEYGINQDNIRGESYLNIVRRNCFYMYVPEWRGYTYQSPNNPQLPPNFPAGQAPVDTGNLMGTIGSGFNQLGQQIGQNPTVQQIGDELNSKWINVKQIPQQILNGSQEVLQNMRGQINQWGQQVFGQNNPGPINNQNRLLTPSEIFNAPTVVPPVQQPHQVNPFSQPNNPNFNPNQQNQPFPYSPANTQNGQPIQNRPGDYLGSMHNVNQPPLSVVQFGNTPSGQPQWPSSGLGNLGWNSGGQTVVGQPPVPQPQPFGSGDIRQQQASPQFNPNPNQQPNQQHNQGWINVGDRSG